MAAPRPVQDTLLVPAPEPVPGAIELRAEPDPSAAGLAAVVERLALNPQVDIAKLEKVIDLQERILRYNAEQAFNAAFSLMQPEIPVIVERGRTDKGMYAELEDIVETVRPILARHGFGLSHKTLWPAEGGLVIVGYLTHSGGHQRTSEFKAPPDTSGSKNAVQALGSTVSYGRRYTTNDLLCIVSRKQDDDGAKSGKPNPPDGYEAWLQNFETVAENGMTALNAMWATSDPALQNYAAKHDSARVREAKAKAKAVKAGAK